VIAKVGELLRRVLRLFREAEARTSVAPRPPVQLK
jgi:hypothetical protein